MAEETKTLLKVFIGSSSESEKQAAHLADMLMNAAKSSKEFTVRADLWVDMFNFGDVTLTRLEQLAWEYDFAAMMITPDDVLESRDVAYNVVRDNVIFEAGLFMSAIGKDRTYLIYPKDFSVKLFSDIKGLTVPTMGTNFKTDAKRALRTTAYDIFDDMAKKGSFVDARHPKSESFYTRTSIDAVIQEPRKRMDAARHEIIITGNDCAGIALSGGAGVRAALGRGVNVKIMCIDPAVDLGIPKMLKLTDPRFGNPDKDLQYSIDSLCHQAEDWRTTFGDILEFRMLPVLPGLGFLITDPGYASGTVKCEIYVPQLTPADPQRSEWWPKDSRPHFIPDPEWREYYIQMFRNYWNMATDYFGK